jgi:hypothetical protein
VQKEREGRMTDKSEVWSTAEELMRSFTPFHQYNLLTRLRKGLRKMDEEDEETA